MQADVATILAMPLVSRGTLVGVLSYGWREPRTIGRADLAFYETVANLFAVVIANASLYAKLSETLRLREEYLAAVAHELRTPVTVIRGTSQLALKIDARDEPTHRAFEAVVRQSGRIASVIDDLLDLMRLGPGPPVLHVERFDLSPVVRQAAEAAARSFEPSRLRVTATGPLMVEADRQQVLRIVTRLVANAYQFAPAGSVEVNAQSDDGRALVSVRDHGLGISPERQPYIFEPIVEPVAAGQTGYLGILSLGLYVSRQFLEAMGGRIWLQTRPGQGSTFTFCLPLARG
jgi:signal transduction histidine kinase